MSEDEPEDLDGRVQALAGGDAGEGVEPAGAHATPGADGGDEAEDHPSPGQFSGHELADRINTFGDQLDPEGDAASTCRVGESYCAVLDHYADAPGKLNLHPGWWALISTIGAGGLIVYRRLEEQQESREGGELAQRRMQAPQGAAAPPQPPPEAPMPDVPDDADASGPDPSQAAQRLDLEG
jgi:hypothetical protein